MFQYSENREECEFGAREDMIIFYREILILKDRKIYRERAIRGGRYWPK